MEIDSHPQSTSSNVKPCDRIVRRLGVIGVHVELSGHLQQGAVDFVKNNRGQLSEVVSAILPGDEEVAEIIKGGKPGSWRSLSAPTMKERFGESMMWLQWLMFEGDPVLALEEISRLGVGQRGVCGAVWGNNDIAYRCKTCQHDPTCAICVPCFQNGNHKGHDYSVIYTGGGCCDCGDVTAWKREGFCSRHKGAEQIQPLSEAFAESVGPVFEALFVCWKTKLLWAEAVSLENYRAIDRAMECKKAATELTFVVVEMLLEFCKQSESLLSFISKRVFSSAGLLEVLVRAERFVHDASVKRLHELLLKLLGEPNFKYEFSKEFLSYYPTVVSVAVEECKDAALKKYPLLPTFSVQIFTVPTLTPRLVKEMNLLTMLLECLGNIFTSCASEDGCLQVSKWLNLHDITFRVIEDIRFAMSHSGVPNYVTKDQQDITRTCIRLLGYVQGMNMQKRETGLHIEEENEHMHFPFVLGHSIANIQSLLADGVFSISNDEDTGDELLAKSFNEENEDGDSLRQSKVGRLSEESYACSVGRTSSQLSQRVDDIDCITSRVIPPSVTWLTHECLRAIENWLSVDKTSGGLLGVSSPSTINLSSSNFSAIRKTLSKIRRGRSIFSRLASSSEDHGGESPSLMQVGARPSFNLHSDKMSGLEKQTTDIGRDSGSVCASGSTDECSIEGDGGMDLDTRRVLSMSEWPEIVYDVSSQGISVHIPFHRFLSLLLQKALRRCFGEMEVSNVANTSTVFKSSAIYSDFFGQILSGCHPYGFSAFIMEHPLRNRVFCAEVHAGMWRKNGDAAVLSCEWYRSVRWSEQGLELDLFLLQCCGAMAPADPYINRILERFGLSKYLNLDPECPDEYEGVLVQEMLTLIIQIVKERRFCGLTKADSLRRELIYKLAIGDFTRSQLVKSLPRDLSKYEHLQEILDSIAVYSNPSGFNQGTYSLRWACWNELDLYHPRWNSRDLQAAEERYSRFRGASALSSQLPKWNKIYPPLRGLARIATCKSILQIVRAVIFYAIFTDETTESRAPDAALLSSLHLLALALDVCSLCKQSDELLFHDRDSIPILEFASEDCLAGNRYSIGELSLLSLLVLLMKMYKRENQDSNLDPGSCDLFSLITTLLKKFAELDSRCMKKLKLLVPEVVSPLTQATPNGDGNNSRSASDGEKRKAKARERQAAVLEKMRAEQAKFLASIDSSVDDGSKSEQVASSSPDVDHEREESAQIFCSLCHDPTSKSSVSFLILVQKSKLLSFVDRIPPSWEHPFQSDKVDVPMPKSKVTEQPKLGAPSDDHGPLSFTDIEQLVQNIDTKFSNYGHSSELDAFLDLLKRQLPAVSSVQVPSISNHKNESISSIESLEDNIYFSTLSEMQEKNVPSSFSDDTELISAEESSARRKLAETLLLGKYIAAVFREMAESPSASGDTRVDKTAKETRHHSTYDGFGAGDCDGISLSSCGHALHQGCLDRYLKSLKERNNRRIVFEGGHIVDPDQGEFLCPVCRRLANSTLPASSEESQKVWSTPNDPNPGSGYSLGYLYKSGEDISFIRLRQGLAFLQSAADATDRVVTLEDFSLQKCEKMSPNLESVSRVLSKLYFSTKQDKFLRSSRVNHSMLMWDVIKYSLLSMETAARSGKTHLTPTYGLDALYNELESSTGFTLSLMLKSVLKAQTKNPLHAFQRYRGIHSFADSVCCSSMEDNNNIHQRGDLLSILNKIDTDLSSPDIQFWNRAADPIIARDPFSSLMWILFCLPHRFLSCEDSLLQLMHVFYAVNVVQVIVTYCGKYPVDVNESGVNDSLVTDIIELMGQCGPAREYFVSNYIGQAVNIKNVIRVMTFPYMRRCALLWKLLTSSVRAPIFDRDNVGSSQPITDSIDRTDGGLMELNEIERLENMFKIPPIDFVLTDELLRPLSSRWFRHFSQVFEVHGRQRSLYIHRYPRNMHCNPVVPFKLMRLPPVYQDLLQRCIKQPCPQCNAILDEPALCLLCGRLCCPNWKHCCRESGCQNHAMTCGAGTGIFLLIKRTTILLQRSARRAPWPSPYLDAFGEEDIEMQRGKPLYLNEERYASLTYMVASHGLDRSSRVLGQTTIGSPFVVLQI